MTTYRYIVPLPSIAESNETLIAKKVIRVLDCSNNIVAENPCNMWNFNHCPTDNDYCNPFVLGDKIYLQLVTPENYFSFSFVSIWNSATNTEISQYAPFVTIEEGQDLNYKTYKNIIIDTTQFTSIDCFYIKIKAYKCRLKEPSDLAEFEACVADVMDQGYSEAEAQQICLDNICDEQNTDTIYSEPYCKVKCQNTIMLSGTYPSHDCYGNYYGNFYDLTDPQNPIALPSSNSNKLQIRVFGEVTKGEINIEEATTNNKRTSTKRIDTFAFRTKKVPLYVVDTIGTIFAAQEMFIDDEQYTKSLNIAKNNEQGNMWIINSTLTQECDENDFSCEN